eukprot:g3349.t1
MMNLANATWCIVAPVKHATIVVKCPLGLRKGCAHLRRGDVIEFQTAISETQLAEIINLQPNGLGLHAVLLEPSQDTLLYEKRHVKNWFRPAVSKRNSAESSGSLMVHENIETRPSTICELCPIGKAQSKKGKFQCDDCESGFSSISNGSARCASCLPGLFSAGGLACQDCPAGKFGRGEASSECMACPRGFDALTNGSRECALILPTSRYIKILSTRAHPSRNLSVVRWTQESEVTSVRMMLRVGSASSDAENASVARVVYKESQAVHAADSTVEATVKDLLYGLKYYFQISGTLSTKPWQTISLVSDPITIECPRFACCGVEKKRRGCESFANLSTGATVATLAAQKGAYRVHEILFVSCPKREACHGGIESECATAFTGMLCHRCKSGYARRGTDGCSACDAQSTTFIIFAILISSLICIYFIHTTLKSSEKTLEIEMCKIALSGLQALTVLGRYPLHWPGGVLTVFNSVGSLFSAAGDVISFSCAMDDKDGSRYFRGSAIILGGPLLIVMCIGIFWAAKAAVAKKEELKYMRSKFTVSIMVVLFLLLPTLNQTTFQLLTCRHVGNDLRVAGDFDEICGGSTHMGYMIGLAVPSLLAYTFGVPALALILLRRMKRSKKLFATREDSYSANVYKFLYGGYNEKTYYWESVIMLRKIVLNVVLVVLSSATPLSQGLVVLLFLIGFTAVHMINMPYSDTLLNRIEMGSLLLSCGVLYAGLFLFDDGLLIGLKTMITALMLTALFLSALIFLFVLCRHVQASRAKSAKKAADKALTKLELVASRMCRASTISGPFSSGGREEGDTIRSNPMHFNSEHEK